MKRFFAASLLLLLALGAYAAPFTAGNLVVVRVGAAGGPALTSAATAAFLDEYTLGGTLVQSIPLPTTAGVGNILTLQGSATSEGFLQFSANMQYLTLGGYNATVGTAAPSGQTAATINRVVGRVDMFGNVDTTTAINSGTAGNIRSVASLNGSQFWASSSSTSVGYDGSFGVAAGATQLSAAPSPTNIRVTRTFGGQLYGTASTSTGPVYGIASIGVGLPTTSGQTTTSLPGFPAASGPSSYDFFMAGSTAWVADDRTTGAGGIQRWTFSGGLWSLSYTLAPSATTGVRGLAVDLLSGPNPILFGTTTDGRIVEFVDTGSGATPTFITPVAATGTALRGIVFIPEPTTVTLLGLGLFGVLCFRRR